MGADTTAALVLAHSWGDRRRRFFCGAPKRIYAEINQVRLLQCVSLLLARPGSAWRRESIPLTGVKRTAMLRRGNACKVTHLGSRACTFAVLRGPWQRAGRMEPGASRRHSQARTAMKHPIELGSISSSLGRAIKHGGSHSTRSDFEQWLHRESARYRSAKRRLPSQR
jgi:hypothetical protein